MVGVRNRKTKEVVVVAPMKDFAKEISERFPGDQEARHHYKLNSPWSYGELRAIRAFEFQFIETKEKYRDISRYELYLNFFSFGKELPFKIIFDLTEEKKIDTASIIRPNYLYPQETCLEEDSETISLFKRTGITIEEGDEVFDYCRYLGAVNSPELRDCYAILGSLFELSKDSSKVERIAPPSQSPDSKGKG